MPTLLLWAVAALNALSQLLIKNATVAGRIEVTVHRTVKDLAGNPLSDGEAMQVAASPAHP